MEAVTTAGKLGGLIWLIAPKVGFPTPGSARQGSGKLP